MAAPSTRVYKVPCKVRTADNNRRSNNNADLSAEHNADHVTEHNADHSTKYNTDHGTNHVTKYVSYVTNHRCTMKSRNNTVKS